MVLTISGNSALEFMPTDPACCNAPASNALDARGNEDVIVGLKALAHPVRLGIIQILASSRDAVCACDLEVHFDLTQPTISHHLRVLREAGLIAAEARSPWVYFSVNRPAVDTLADVLRKLG